MNKSMKGALLSGLVFPGLGQIVQKKYKMGAAIILTVVVCLYFIISEAVEQANIVLKELEQGGGFIDIDAITDAASRASSTTESNASYFIILIIICWVISIIDAFRTGKKQE